MTEPGSATWLCTPAALLDQILCGNSYTMIVQKDDGSIQLAARIDPRCASLDLRAGQPARVDIHHIDDCTCGTW